MPFDEPTPDTGLEQEVITRFVTRAKRERFLSFVSSKKRRDDFVTELRNPEVFDSRWVTEITGADRNAGRLVDVLSKSGVGGRVYVVSSNSEWDAHRFQMSWFAQECCGAGFDTLAYCWKSQVGFYEQHHSGFTYVLKRTRSNER